MSDSFLNTSNRSGDTLALPAPAPASRARVADPRRKHEGIFLRIADKARLWVEDAHSRRDLGGCFSQRERDSARKIDTVVLPLGPYRNLTTMSAALYALHPNALVLNHAAVRVFGSAIDPFADLSEDRWLTFKTGAVLMAQRGRSGRFGGSVLLSHAFGQEDLLRTYEARFGKDLRKPGATALFWKDSMRIQNRFMAQPEMFGELLARQPKVRFLFPVRNPLDCARSNLQTGHWRHLAPEGPDFDKVLRRILESLRWFRERERVDPDRFLTFTELEIDPDLPERIARFSNLPAPASWAREDAPKAIEVVRRTAHSQERLALYTELVAALFADDPDMRGRLEGFLG